jgi:hypothetical protein
MSVWLWLPRPRRDRARGEAFAVRNLAYVPPDLVPCVVRAMRKGDRLMALVLFSAGVAFCWLAAGDAPGLRLMSWLPILVGFAGLLRCDMLGRDLQLPAGTPLVARARRVTARDYVASRVRLACGVVVCACVALGLVTLASWRWGGVPASAAFAAAAAAVVTVVLAALAQVSAAVMCARPQVAVDACHLYVHDAWRAEAMAGSLSAVGFVTSLASGTVWQAGDLPYGLTVAWAVLQLAALMALLSLAMRSSRLWFRRRLWPTLDPERVLIPGDLPAAVVRTSP